MAGCSAWRTETDGKVNYTKLSRLLIDGGTFAVRSVFDGIHPPSNLTAVLNTKLNIAKLKKLKKSKGKILDNDQWDKLFPPSGTSAKSEDFDITLLFVLLRNICRLAAPVTGWDALPPDTDTSPQANLVRIKYYRNQVYHTPSTNIDDGDFEQYWQKISSPLVSLGLKQEDIDELKDAPLGEKDYNQLLSDWNTSDEQNRNINCLDKFNFTSLVESLCKKYHPNSRQWVLDEVKSYIEHDFTPECCIVQIKAGPGMGKSIVAAKICQIYKDEGQLGGCHFFQFSNKTRSNPRLMFQSIARQLCDSLPGYEALLENRLQTYSRRSISDMDCEELCTILLEEPLSECENSTASRIVIVLDALDECSGDLKDELCKVLQKKSQILPSWLRFVITTRPPPSIATLESRYTVNIDQDNSRNIEDLEDFFYTNLSRHTPENNLGIYVRNLTKMANGLFLVAYFVLDHLEKQGIASLDKVNELFPRGISSVYDQYFSRLKTVLLPYISDEESFYKMLEAVVAARIPIPKDIFYRVLGAKSELDVPRNERQTWRKALSLLHTLFPVENDHVTAFHKTVVDWLVCDEPHEFSVRIEDGNEELARQCYDVLSDIRNGRKELEEPLTTSGAEKYALECGLEHIDTSSSIGDDKKIETSSNLYILSAIISDCYCNKLKFGYRDPLVGVVPKFKDIYQQSILCYKSSHRSSCSSHRVPRFGHYLKFVVQSAHVAGIEDATPRPLDLFKKHHYPYCETKPDITLPPSFFTDMCDLPVCLPCEQGFIVVLHVRRPPSLTLHKYQLDGVVTNRLTYCGKNIVAISPDSQYVAIADHQGNYIDLLLVSTFERVHVAVCPNGAIKTCHVFRHEQLFIVCHAGNEVYVIEGDTGRLHNTITVHEDARVEDVNRLGHILITRDWIDEDGIESTRSNRKWRTKLVLKAADGVFNEATYKQISVHRYNTQEAINVYPRIEKHCNCYNIIRSHPSNMYKAIRFSHDGRLFAYHYYNPHVFIVNTSDGSLYKRVFIGRAVIDLVIRDILFLSESYLLVTVHMMLMRQLLVIDVQTNEIEALPLPTYPSVLKHLPRNVGKPFTILKTNNCKPITISQFVFHNFVM